MNQGFNQAAGALGFQQQPPNQYGGPPMGGPMQPYGQGPGGPPGMGGYPGGPGGGPMAAPGQHGAKGQVRNPVTVLLIGLVTCGIYQMIWFISTAGEMSTYLQRDEPNWLKIMGLSIVTCGLYSLYWQIVVLGPLLQEMQQRAGLANPQNHGWMYIIPYYNVILMQQELNKVWQSPM
jgi:hypothetical protein